MAIEFPLLADTPLERLTYLLRIQRRLIARSQDERDATITRAVILQPDDSVPPGMTFIPAVRSEPLEIPDPEQWSAFKSWERTWWIPRWKASGERLAEYRSAASPSEFQSIKIQQITDTTWDLWIDLEALL